MCIRVGWMIRWEWKSILALNYLYSKLLWKSNLHLTWGLEYWGMDLPNG
jgi:hypothetical protein